jgi:hypothetical protein
MSNQGSFIKRLMHSLGIETKEESSARLDRQAQGFTEDLARIKRFEAELQGIQQELATIQRESKKG